MGGDHEYLTAREFYKGIERIERRFDVFEERHAGHADRLTALEVRAGSLPAADKKRAAGWAGATAGFIWLVVEAVRAALAR